MKSIIPSERIERRIFMIRGRKVMLDKDIAELYGVATKKLNQAVRRNQERFPAEFMFRLTEKERDKVVTNCDHLRSLKFSYRMPFAFTDYGVVMLSSVLNSPRAVKVNIEIIRTFIHLSRLLASSQDVSKRLDELEKKYDGRFKTVFQALRRLLAEPPRGRRPIGFRLDESPTFRTGGANRRK